MECEQRGDYLVHIELARRILCAAVILWVAVVQEVNIRREPPDIWVRLHDVIVDEVRIQCFPDGILRINPTTECWTLPN